MLFILVPDFEVIPYILPLWQVPHSPHPYPSPVWHGQS